MVDILQKIYAAKALHREREMLAEPYESVRARALARRGERRGFLAALRRAKGAAIIAEIKRASPSAGMIAQEFDPIAIAQRYHHVGADAISVLTEQDHFLGDSFLDAVRASTTEPLLRKDFLVTRYDVAQSAAYGADCILLILAGLNDESVRECMDEARSYDLDVLVEIHDAQELQRAIDLGATLIGINNRNLRTFKTDLAVSEELLPRVPPGVFVVSESGIRERSEIDRLYAAGAHGFLIGEALMRSQL